MEYVSLTATVRALFSQDTIQIMNLVHAGRESTPFPTAISPAQPQGPSAKGRGPVSVEGNADNMWNISELWLFPGVNTFFSRGADGSVAVL